MSRIVRVDEISASNDIVEFLVNFSDETHVWCDDCDFATFIIQKIGSLTKIKQLRKKLPIIFESLNTCPRCSTIYYTFRENLSNAQNEHILQKHDNQRLLKLLRTSENLNMITITEILTYNWKCLKHNEILFHFVKLLKKFYKTESLFFSKMTFSLILLIQTGDGDLLPNFSRTFKYLKKQKLVFLHSGKEEWDYLLNFAEKDDHFLPEKSVIAKQDWLLSVLIYISMDTTYFNNEIIDPIVSIYKKTDDLITQELCFRVCAAYIIRDISELNNCKYVYETILTNLKEKNRPQYKGAIFLRSIEYCLIEHFKNFSLLKLEENIYNFFSNKKEIIYQMRNDILTNIQYLHPSLSYFCTDFFKHLAISSLKAETITEKEKIFIESSIDRFVNKIYANLRHGPLDVVSLHKTFMVWSEIIDNACGNYNIFTDFIFLFIYEIEFLLLKIPETDKVIDIFKVFKRKFFAILDLNDEKLSEEILLYRDLIKSDFSTYNIRTILFSKSELETITKILEKMSVYYDRFRDYPRCFEKLLLLLQKSAVISYKVYAEIFNFAWNESKPDLIIKTLAILLPKVQFNIPVDQTFLANLDWLEILYRVRGCDIQIIECFVLSYYSWMKIHNIQSFSEHQKEKIFDFVDHNEILTIERKKKVPSVDILRPALLSGFSQDEKKIMYEQNGANMGENAILLGKTEDEKNKYDTFTSTDSTIESESTIHPNTTGEYIGHHISRDEKMNTTKSSINILDNQKKFEQIIDEPQENNVIEVSSNKRSVNNTQSTNIQHIFKDSNSIKLQRISDHFESAVEKNNRSSKDQFVLSNEQKNIYSSKEARPCADITIERTNLFSSLGSLSNSSITTSQDDVSQFEPITSEKTCNSHSEVDMSSKQPSILVPFTNNEQHEIDFINKTPDQTIVASHAISSASNAQTVVLLPKIQQPDVSNQYLRIQNDNFMTLASYFNRNNFQPTILPVQQDIEGQPQKSPMEQTRDRVLSYFNENKEYEKITIPICKKIEMALEEHEGTFTNSFFKRILNFTFDNTNELKTVDNIPSVFESYQQYEAVFEPLLFNECKEALFKSISDISKNMIQKCKFVDEASTSDFLELTFQVTETSPDMQILLFFYLDAENLASKVTISTSDYFLGIVIDRKQEKGQYVIVLTNTTIKRPKMNSTLNFLSLASFSSFYREFMALKNLQFFPHLSSILVQKDEKEGPCLIENIKLLNLYLEPEKLNESQNSAIRHIFSNKSFFSLIHGPPGTGKTRTIVTAVKMFFHPPLLNSLRQNIQLENKTPRILICAPSNNAVDEITRRVIKLRFSDRMDPRLNVIRVGVPTSISSDLQDYTLDSIIENDLESKKRQFGISTLEFSSQERIKRKYELLKQSDVVCATLSSSAKDLIKIANISFDVLIIDEACQSVETSTLIPLKFEPFKVILIGDPRQLPPTVLSNSKPYQQCLFERLMKTHPTIFLNTQYRMHPQISEFPNRFFYEGRLMNHSCVISRNNPFSNLLKPIAFIKTMTDDKIENTFSFSNHGEARVVSEIIRELLIRVQKYDLTNKIGVITPYKAQQHKIKSLLREISSDIFRYVSVNTVDGFQGQEKDIIIISTVRSRNIGFLNDIRRMNVSITRSKHALIILGKMNILSKSKPWMAIISHLTEKGAVYDNWGKLFI